MSVHVTARDCKLNEQRELKISCLCRIKIHQQHFVPAAPCILFVYINTSFHSFRIYIPLRAKRNTFPARASDNATWENILWTRENWQADPTPPPPFLPPISKRLFLHSWQNKLAELQKRSKTMGCPQHNLYMWVPHLAVMKWRIVQIKLKGATSRCFESFLWWPKLRLKCWEILKLWFAKEEKNQRGDSKTKRNKDGRGWTRLKRIRNDYFEKFSKFSQNTWRLQERWRSSFNFYQWYQYGSNNNNIIIIIW